MIWQKWWRKKSKRKKKMMGERVMDAAVECPSEHELSFDGELDETVAVGFFGRGISPAGFVENLSNFSHTSHGNFFHRCDGLVDELEDDGENDFSAAMAESSGGGGRKRTTKAAVDIHQSLVVGGRTNGDPALEFIIAHVGTTKVPVVKADKNKAFSVQVWQLFCVRRH